MCQAGSWARDPRSAHLCVPSVTLGLTQLPGSVAMPLPLTWPGDPRRPLGPQPRSSLGGVGNWLRGPLHRQCWIRQGDTVPDGCAGSVSRWPRSCSPGPSLLAAEPALEAAQLRHLRVRLVPQDAGLVGGALGEMGESGHLPVLEPHLRRCPRRVPVPRLAPCLHCSPETAFAEEKLRPRAGKGLAQPPAHCLASGTPVPSLRGAGQQRPIPLNTKWPLGGSGAQTGLGKHPCPTGCGVITGGLPPDEGGARHREAGHGPAPDDAARPG